MAIYESAEKCPKKLMRSNLKMSNRHEMNIYIYIYIYIHDDEIDNTGSEVLRKVRTFVTSSVGWFIVYTILYFLFIFYSLAAF